MLDRVRSLLSKLSFPRVATDRSPGQMYSHLRHQALVYDREVLGRFAPYSQLQDMENALANYDLAIQNDPGYANSYTNRAFAYYKLGRYENGVADCNRALALRPDHANTYNNRGLCRAALGDKEGARADFQRALEPPAPPVVIQEALSGLHALDHPGEPIPVWKSPSVWWCRLSSKT